MTEPRQLVAYVDIDDTLVRTFGSKRIPMTGMVRHVRELKEAGVALFAWSTGGGDYACESATELGIEDCFNAFLPKPNVIIDDQSPSDWRRTVHKFPGAAPSKTVGEYGELVYGVDG